jgi:hypothetical protein
MAFTDYRKRVFDDMELKPKTKALVPAGSDGQLAAVSDVAGKNLFIRKGSDLVPAVDVDSLVTNSEVITMQVNPATGTSPPVGTVVHNQAEYDALGYDLLYVQDAVDILPALLTFSVRAELAGGNHLPKPGSGGDVGFDMVFNLVNADVHHNGKTFSTEASMNFSGGSIFFIGVDKTIIDAEQAGTSTSTTIVRTSGTWTAHAHRGKFALILTGAGAGSRGLILDNDTTTLYMVYPAFSSGSVTFEINEPAAELQSSGGYAAIRIKNASITVGFDSVRFGNSSTASKGLEVSGGSLYIDYSQLYLGNSASRGLNVRFYGRYASTQSFYNIVPSTNVRTGYAGVANFTGCFLYGHSSSLLQLVDGGRVGCTYLTIQGDGISPTRLIELGNGVLWPLGALTLVGTTTDTGIYLPDGAAGAVLGSGVVGTCGNAFDIRGNFDCALSWSGSGNTIGWNITRGGVVVIESPASVAATTEISIDGITHPYSDIPNSGDGLEGQYGSRILRK